MRKPYARQQRFDGSPISELSLNFECRDQIIPILAALQYVYLDKQLRTKITKLVAGDLNHETRRDVGRNGLDDWQVIVLAAVRLGCNLDYDKLQDLAENHRAVRCVLGVGDWDDSTSFSFRRIHDTLCRLKPETLHRINHTIASSGQDIDGQARQHVRADSFVVETNIHHPSESTLIFDGVRKIVPLCALLAEELDQPGWRQSKHLTRAIKKRVRVISQIVASKSPRTKAGLPQAYANLLDRVVLLIERAKTLQSFAETAGDPAGTGARAAALKHWIELTLLVCDTAHRRVLLKEKVPSSEKLFSLFEPHTQLYRRGKAMTPNQFGRQLLVVEDGAGFISHYHFMDRDAQDPDVIVEQMRQAQKLHCGEIESASLDRGFYTPENEEQLSTIVEHPCLPPRHRNQYADRMANCSIEFRRARMRHSGVESAIGALQRGTGLKRCRDRSELGMERYIGLAILGRNLHVLGKLLIARCEGESAAGRSKRLAA